MFHPSTGALWSHEHGPRGGDEINIITAGDNYGWPTVSHGKEYIGVALARVLRLLTRHGFGHHQLHLLAWPYGGSMFPQLNGHLLVGSLKFKRLYLVQLSAGVPQDEFVILWFYWPRS